MSSLFSNPWPGYIPEFGFPDEPRSFQKEDFDNLLIHATRKGASDITLQTEEPVFAYIDGNNIRLTKRSFNSNEIELITNYIYGSAGVSRIRSGEDIDTRHPVVIRTPGVNGSTPKVEKMGFRVNITGCWARGDENGMQITCRSIKSTPMRLSEMGIEEGIVESFFPEQGMVCVVGPTGSGKSTLLAGGMRKIIEDPDSHKKIITLEAPIEFTYDDIDRATTIVSQHEIPRHLKSFARGVRNTLRRAPKIILVGETRDGETVSASLEASQTGHTVYTTVHADSVAQTISRLANMFPPSERMTKVFELSEALRMIVVQRLVPRADGKGRVALREFLPFDQTVRDHLRVVSSLREAVHVVSKLVEKRGQTMLSAAQRAFDAGHISADYMSIFERESRSDLIEDIGFGGD
ncbi:type IV pilus twitching motility protein PilT [Paucibacter soli]|uniref:type IV pilus twitching motility protein PilT n=1 Tax=Paucibacter soli TaxID=3133433 RepID=UPI0030B7CF4A